MPDEPTIYASPTERGPIIAELVQLVGSDGIEVSSLPERYGVDFLWRGSGGWFGVQRKEIRDFAASREDGRLKKELAQMDHKIELPVVAVEGRLQWTTEGVAELARGKVITRASWLATKLSFAQRGVHVFECPTAADTAEMIVNTMRWSCKGRHSGVGARPKAVGEWGKATSREWAAHLLESFEGIGHDTALAIVDHFGGVPLAWQVSESELRGVAGVGKTRAGNMFNALTSEGVR